eukprot:CAMPEP_0172036736 /NCGR_PEP_ID=MMETSP1041-20130122/22333_1 /TAXON_ID=464988 /ORGANISM="Hemiselmis andersenii, Strain CCMP439" /LENGTH=41 /DNA_ID= /DNA_START= /DNA_END= /DNA_ORIENTATION=
MRDAFTARKLLATASAAAWIISCSSSPVSAASHRQPGSWLH